MSNKNNQFFRDYQSLIVTVWQDSAEEAKLLRNPTKYAADHGLPVAAGNTVVLDRTQPEGMLVGSKLEAAWNAASDVHTMYVPATPLINFEELTEDELEAVSGAFLVIIIIIV